jgi:periplasmic divalent cation tolerance protein
LTVTAKHLEVKTTTDSKEEAESLARAIVEARLAACVQVLGPIWSIYWWNEKVEEAAEWVCTMKTPSDRFAALERFIKVNHSYETPEIIATPVTAGSTEYLDWLDKQTRD